MDDQITWEEPPRLRGPGNLDGFREALRANPGQWAVHPGSGSANATTRVWRSWPGFEAVTRTVDGQLRTYVRYVGDES